MIKLTQNNQNNGNKRLLHLQKIFERTPDGRIIGKQIMPIVENTYGNPDNEKMTECMNCRIILDSDYFHSGCPNCGSKEIKMFKGLDNKKVEK